MPKKRKKKKREKKEERVSSFCDLGKKRRKGKLDSATDRASAKKIEREKENSSRSKRPA